jgi:predicted carbohydrate-binding protein with CBM5 and CBM33 domain
MWLRRIGTMLLGLAVAVSQAAGVLGHGFMSEPAARNVQRNSNYCPHCLPAGGPGKTYANGRVWPNSLHGVCGDAHDGPRDHEAGGKFATPPKIAAVYLQGQVVTLRVKITAPHGGRFSFGLCPVPDGATPDRERAVTTQKCFDANRLVNAADGTPYWWFGKRGNGEYTMQFKLPPSITCKRCTLQWHYETGNSCNIPGTPEQHQVSAGLVPCSQSSSMEEFWNCADVSILKRGSKLPAAAAAAQAKAARAPAEVIETASPQVRAARRAQAAQLRAQARTLPASQAAARRALEAQARTIEDMADADEDIVGDILTEADIDEDDDTDEDIDVVETYAGHVDDAHPRRRRRRESNGINGMTTIVIVAIVGIAGMALPVALAVAVLIGVLVWTLSAPLRDPASSRDPFRDWPMPTLPPAAAQRLRAWLRQGRQDASSTAAMAFMAKLRRSD